MSQFIEMFGDPMTNTKAWFEFGYIGNYTQIVLGTTPNSKNSSYWNGEIKWITPVEMTEESYYIYDTERHLTEEGLKAANLTLLPCRSVLFSTRAPIGKVGLAGSPMCCNQGFKNFVCGDQLNPVYLYYSLIFKREYLVSLGTGTTFKELSKKAVENLKIAVPPLILQNKFEEIYQQADKSKFGDFKSQFIEMFKDLPVNGTISDLTEGTPTSVKKTYGYEDLIEYIDISSIDSTSKTVLETSKHFVGKAPSRAQQCVKNGDILVSTVRPVNRNIAVIDNDIHNLVASTGFCVLRPKEGYRDYLLSIVTSDLYTEKMCDKASGGLYPAVNNSDVLNYGIHIPDEGLANRVSIIYKQADKSKFELKQCIENIDKVIKSLING